MQWTIHQVDQQYIDGKLVPTTAHWRCSHSEGAYSGSVYSTASVQGLTDLSIESVLNFLWANGVDKDSAEQACMSQVNQNRASSLILNNSLNVDAPKTAIEELKAKAYECIDKWHQESMLKLTGEPTQVEQTTWDGKVGIAEAIQSNKQLTNLQLAYLTSKAVTPDQYPAYAVAVMSKASAYWALVGIADKVRSDCKNRISVAKTEEEINNATEQNIQECNAALQAAIKSMGG